MRHSLCSRMPISRKQSKVLSCASSEILDKLVFGTDPFESLNTSSANRLYIHEKIYDKFADLLKKKVSELKLGFGLDSETTQGPLVNASAVRKVIEHVNDATSKGAQIII